MVDLLYHLISLLVFDAPLLYCYINLRSLIISCLFSGDICLSLGISLSTPICFSSFVTVSKLFCGEVFETFVVLSAFLLALKSPVAFAVF